MPKIHATVDRLYSAASKLRNITGQSAVARLLGSSPQTVKNWEQRGLSLEGALIAQSIIGCDANWLLGTHDQMDKPIWTPNPNKTQEPKSASRPALEWPFRTLDRSKVSALNDFDKGRLEAAVALSAATLKIDITLDEANEKAA